MSTLGVRKAALQIVVLGLMVVATACASVELRPITPAPSVSARSVTAGKGFGITVADDGRTIQIDSDTDVVRLVLSDDVDWTVNVDTKYLQLEQLGPIAGQGFTAKYWLFRVKSVGEMLLAASGPTMCGPAVSTCDRRERTFSVRLKIG